MQDAQVLWTAAYTLFAAVTKDAAQRRGWEFLHRQQSYHDPTIEHNVFSSL